MRRWCIGASLLVGCYQPRLEAACSVHCNYAGERACPGDQRCEADNLCHGAGGCGGTADARNDSPIGDGRLCFGSGLLEVCPDTVSAARVFLPTVINTDADPMCTDYPQVQGPEVCLIYGESIETSGATRAEGARPLVLVATTTIHIDHLLDVASHITSSPGAGNAPSACGTPIPPTISGGGGGGGAAGGTAQGGGGNGGVAGSASQGMSAAPTAPLGVRGGCDGGFGIGTIDGRPGRGGGAVYLIAGSAIVVGTTARIDASGSAATAGSGGSGSGAGSGGMIGLDAFTLQIDGTLMANGGGGASGFNLGSAVSGNDSSNPSAGGLGGTHNFDGSGGNGAGGGTLIGSPGDGVTTQYFGGGGGGGAGWLAVYGAPLGQNVRFSPSPSSP